MMQLFVGFDSREQDAFMVAATSAMRRTSYPLDTQTADLSILQEGGMYTRETETRDGKLYDVISQHPMATEFAISRFLTPHLAKNRWALFVDCDVMFTVDPYNILQETTGDKAVYVVKHQQELHSDTKMDGQLQTYYDRKNWSSVMLFDMHHPANDRLTLEMVNTLPGRDLHAFCWLKDHEIGELDKRWNYLVGYPYQSASDPYIIHWTDGGPWFDNYQNVMWAERWRNEKAIWETWMGDHIADSG